MRFEYLLKYLSQAEIEQATRLEASMDELWDKAKKLEKQIKEQIKVLEDQVGKEYEKANQLAGQYQKLLQEAEQKYSDDRYNEQSQAVNAEREAWKKRNCSISLPAHCPRLKEFEIETYRGDCPRKIESPVDSDGDELRCKGCKFLKSNYEGTEEICTTYCEMDVSVYSYHCNRDEILKVTPEQLEVKKVKALNSCQECLNCDHRGRRFGD